MKKILRFFTYIATYVKTIPITYKSCIQIKTQNLLKVLPKVLRIVSRKVFPK